MIEHTKRDGRTITLERAAQRRRPHCSARQEARAGALLVAPKTRLGYAEMALAAQAGATRLDVFAAPRLAILSTGDEVVDARAKPGPLQVRNSNGISIEILARTAGAQTDSARKRARRKRRAADSHRTRPRSGYPGSLRRRIHGQVRSGRAGARRSGRGISFHGRRDSSRASRGVCDLPQ